MREIINLNDSWIFTQNNESSIVNIPHCFNNLDGQDGGNDYFRGEVSYQKELNINFDKCKDYYLEINGASLKSRVVFNNKEIAKHNNGFSRYRVYLNPYIENENHVTIYVDNSYDDKIYPQVADFTFYGGLYRDVNLIVVNKTHFSLDYFGSNGVKVTPNVESKSLTIELFDIKDDVIRRFIVKNQEGEIITCVDSTSNITIISFEDIILWEGLNSPYLYTLEALLVDNDTILDNITLQFGFRSFHVDPEDGFILNGKSYPLRGVARHQDYKDKGNAISKSDQERDLELILELGANTIRLSHYQHDEYFISLCDRAGIIIYCEIPYISNHNRSANDNAYLQLKELIVQNYNHPSIAFWGLSNEITMSGEEDEDMIKLHEGLNKLAHSLDSTRYTNIALLSFCSQDAAITRISDTITYNHYFGWYTGNVDEFEAWFDNFHKKYPKLPIGLSEYGAEALNYHSSNPTLGDYTEEYQALYHERVIKSLFGKKYIFVTYAWNMFDFGSDSRCEGGVSGVNNKGVVSFDREYKKDSFYIYKAYLSKEIFTHITSKRYVERVEEYVEVKVYTNEKELTLYVNDIEVEKKIVIDHICTFKLKNENLLNILVKGATSFDSTIIKKVDKPNNDYILKEKSSIINWFEIEQRDGYHNLNSKIEDIFKSFRGKICLIIFVLTILRKSKKKDKRDSKAAEGMLKNKNILKLIGSFTILKLAHMASSANLQVSKDDLLKLNKKLIKIRKAER